MTSIILSEIIFIICYYIKTNNKNYDNNRYINNNKIIKILNIIMIFIIFFNSILVKIKVLSPVELKIFFDKYIKIINAIYIILYIYSLVYISIYGFYYIRKIANNHFKLKKIKIIN